MVSSQPPSVKMGMIRSEDEEDGHHSDLDRQPAPVIRHRSVANPSEDDAEMCI